MSVELGLLLRRQDRANLRTLLSMDGLTALHHLASLLHVGAEGNAVAVLPGSTRGIGERLGAIAQRLALGLILLVDRLDLRFLGFGQVEITAETAAFATAAFTFPEITIGPFP